MWDPQTEGLGFLPDSVPNCDLGHGFTPKPLCLAHRVSLVNVTGSQAHQHVGRCGKAHDAAKDSCPQEKSPPTVSHRLPGNHHHME